VSPGKPTTSAIEIPRFGAPEALVERRVPLREVGPGDLHIEVHASGVNFADLLARAGLYAASPEPPFSPGFEVAGVVVRVGSAVTDWTVGDRAVALLRFGGYARDLVVPAGQVFPYPDGLTVVQAAAVPVVFLTAWVCLFEAARSREGETALVLGAAGGVGTAAVQLALRHGLAVVGTAGSEAKREFVTGELGAEACFDSRGDWEPEVRLARPDGVHVALDPVGGRATAACRRLLAPLGRLVVYGLSEALPGARRSWPRAAMAWLRTPRVHPLALVDRNQGMFGVQVLHLWDQEALLRPAVAEIYRAVGAGELRPVIDRTFPLTRDGAVAAHRHLHGRGNIGKVVLAS